jgi:hypothetical protein
LPILYHPAVQEVHYGAHGVTVVVEGGRALSADAVVVTVPLGVLKAGHITFSPPLPLSKEKVIERFGCDSIPCLWLADLNRIWDALQQIAIMPVEFAMRPPFAVHWEIRLHGRTNGKPSRPTDKDLSLHCNR